MEERLQGRIDVKIAFLEPEQDVHQEDERVQRHFTERAEILNAQDEETGGERHGNRNEGCR